MTASLSSAVKSVLVTADGRTASLRVSLPSRPKKSARLELTYASESQIYALSTDRWRVGPAFHTNSIDEIEEPGLLHTVEYVISLNLRSVFVLRHHRKPDRRLVVQLMKFIKDSAGVIVEFKVTEPGPRTIPDPSFLSHMNAAVISAANAPEDGYSPKVGAVLISLTDPLFSITSFRKDPSVPEGKHCEECVLIKLQQWFEEKKSIPDQLVLFTTLEPCTRASRKDRRLSCSELLVNAKHEGLLARRLTSDEVPAAGIDKSKHPLVDISEVYIGMYDPNPTVTRAGWHLLRSKQIQCHDFDLSFHKPLERLNRMFIKNFTGVVFESPHAFNPDYYNGEARFYSSSLQHNFGPLDLDICSSDSIYVSFEKRYFSVVQSPDSAKSSKKPFILSIGKTVVLTDGFYELELTLLEVRDESSQAGGGPDLVRVEWRMWKALATSSMKLRDGSR